MRTRLLFGVFAVSAVFIYVAATAQQPEKISRPSDGDREIEKATQAYVDAFNKGDLDGILAGWGTDAEYIDETGKSVKGRQALADMFKTLLKESKGGKMQVKSNKIRFLKDDVAMQDGSVLMKSSS